MCSFADCGACPHFEAGKADGSPAIHVWYIYIYLFTYIYLHLPPSKSTQKIWVHIPELWERNTNPFSNTPPGVSTRRVVYRGIGIRKRERSLRPSPTRRHPSAYLVSPGVTDRPVWSDLLLEGRKVVGWKLGKIGTPPSQLRDVLQKGTILRGNTSSRGKLIGCESRESSLIAMTDPWGPGIFTVLTFLLVIFDGKCR